jgi:2,3-bisphosphoglycerate-dependent phosphoglycerate mutase
MFSELLANITLAARLMELYIIRHGQSENNILQNEIERTSDPNLTNLGKQQAEKLAEWLSHSENCDPIFSKGGGFAGIQQANPFGITHLYCSAMIRALQTAAPLSKALNLHPEVWIDIHEQGGMYLDKDGNKIGFPGLTRREILGEFPDYVLPQTITDAGWYDATRGYEELYTGAGRAIKVALELRRRATEDAEFKDARIAIITHGTFIDLMLKAFLGLLPNRSFYFTHYNTAITCLSITADYILMRYINRVDHLPHEMIS